MSAMFPDVSIVVPALLLLIPILLVSIINRSRISGNCHQPPSPPQLPLIGNLHQLGSPLHRSLFALSRKYGPLMLLNLGRVQTLVVSSPDTAEEILKTNDHIFASRPSLKAARIVMCAGRDVVFTPYGQHWKQTRKLCVNHLLSMKMVQSFRTVLEEEVASMVSKISETRSEFNMSELLILFVNKYLCRIISGRYFREEGRNSYVCQLVEENSVVLGMMCVGDFMPSLGWLDKFLGLEARATRQSRNWDAVLDEIIAVHAEDREVAQRKPDFVDVLLAMQGDEDNEFPIKAEIIKAILLDMLNAGTDTTTLVLDWGMSELLRNPAKMKILQDEVRAIAKSHSRITEEDLSKMSYLKAVIKEVLRLHPPAPTMVPHESIEDCTIQSYRIPKKTRVIVNVWAIGRDPKYWEEPEEFRPERFLGSGSSIDYRGRDFEFIPFGSGRRICPGMQFAGSTLELAFANLVNWFDWELPDGMKSEDLDMSDSPGLTARRKQNLQVVAKFHYN